MQGGQDMVQPTRRMENLRIVLLAALSGAIEFYSFVVFIFLSPVIAQLFFPATVSPGIAWLQTIGIFFSGYLARPLGGIVVAHFGDLFGRKRAFAFSVLLMSLSTLAIALTPTYFTIGAAAPIMLIVLRILQGAAIGGEIPGAWTLVSENVSSRCIGLACGMICSGLGLGILGGTLTVSGMNLVFTQEEMLGYGWRIPFMISGALGIVAFYLRRWLRESPVFKKVTRNRSLVVELPLTEILRNHLGGVLLSMILTWILAATVLMTALLTPTLLQRVHGYDQLYTLGLASFGLVFHVAGCTLAGFVLDRTTAGRFLVGGGLLFGVSAFAFYWNTGEAFEVVAMLYAAMGLASGIVTVVPYGMVRVFPAAVRFTGISFSYNVAYAVAGAVTTSVAASAASTQGMLHAYYMLLVAGIAVATGLYLRGGRVLRLSDCSDGEH